MKWSKLKSIADIRFVKSMYVWIFIVPIVANALSNIGDFVKVTMFGYTFDLVTSIPFSWHAFFFSAFLFVIANAIYFYHCPDIIKEHSDYANFISHGKTNTHLMSYASDIKYHWDDMQDDLEGNDHALQNLLPISEPDSDDAIRRGVFWVVRDKADIYKPKARRMAVLCYLIAGCLMLLVLAQNFLTVADYGIRSIERSFSPNQSVP